MADRTPEIAVLAVLALLVAGCLLLGGGGGDDGGEAEAISPQRLARVEQRVEELRGLDFKRPVRVTVMSPEEVRDYGVREERAAGSQARDAASEELLKLLGLIAPDVRLAQVTESIYGEQVAGFYDPGNERLALVEGVGIDDVTLAHELTHALEDQHFDLTRLGGNDGGEVVDEDAASAESGLVEGTATVLMMRYLERYPEALTFGDALGQLWGTTGSTPLPPYVMRSLLFPYEQGERFVSRLLEEGGWRLVDEALRERPPRSTAELLDADRWLERAPAARVRVPPADAPGAGWRRVAGSTLGRFDLAELLREPVGERAAGQLARTWEGGRYALWRRGPLPADDCAAPCLRRDALALRLRLETPAAAGAVAAALGGWLASVRDGELTAGGGSSSRWALPGDTAAVTRTDGATVTLTLAPTAALAQRLAR
jgi:hypothetical protein